MNLGGIGAAAAAFDPTANDAALARQLSEELNGVSSTSRVAGRVADVARASHMGGARPGDRLPPAPRGVGGSGAASHRPPRQEGVEYKQPAAPSPAASRQEGQPVAESPPPAFLINNPLSAYYIPEIRRKLGIGEEAFAIGLPLVYLLGMMGYALSLPFRVVQVALKALQWVGALFGSLFTAGYWISSRQLWVYTKIFVGTIGESLSAAVGVVCPPLAYKLDEFIQKDSDIHNHSPLTMWTRDPNLLLAPSLDRWDQHVAGRAQAYVDAGEKIRRDLHREFAVFKEAAKSLASKLNIPADDIPAGIEGEPQKLTQLAFFLLILKQDQSWFFSPKIDRVRERIVAAVEKDSKLKPNERDKVMSDFDQDVANVKRQYPLVVKPFNQKVVMDEVVAAIAAGKPSGNNEALTSLVQSLTKLASCFEARDRAGHTGLIQITQD